LTGSNPSTSLCTAGPVAGLYLLHVWLEQEATLVPSRLGPQTFRRGDYLYVGSARGSGGLRARILRHARSGRSPASHWHIDTLLAPADLLGAWWSPLEGQPDGFGASDCRCEGHLVYFQSRDSLERAIVKLTGALSGQLHSEKL
jgi:Uri superfamily endonuclease